MKGNEKNLSLADLPLKTGWRKFLRRKGRDQVVNSRRQEGESGSGRNRKRSRCDRPSFPHEFCNPVRCLKQRCLRLTRNTMIFKSEEGTRSKASTGHPKWEMLLPMGRHKYMNYTTYLYTYICLHVHTCLCMYMHKCTHSRTCTCIPSQFRIRASFGITTFQSPFQPMDRTGRALSNPWAMHWIKNLCLAGPCHRICQYNFVASTHVRSLNTHFHPYCPGFCLCKIGKPRAILPECSPPPHGPFALSPFSSCCGVSLVTGLEAKMGKGDLRRPRCLARPLL